MWSNKREWVFLCGTGFDFIARFHHFTARPLIIHGMVKIISFLTTYWYLFPFLFIRLLATFFSQIPDCDEVFNYWEPLHYLLYGFGLQTWEYSPLFALRSYSFPLIHSIPIHFSEYFLGVTSKIALFYSVRTTLAVVCCGTEIYFVSAIVRKYGNKIGYMTGKYSKRRSEQM